MTYQTGTGPLRRSWVDRAIAIELVYLTICRRQIPKLVRGRRGKHLLNKLTARRAKQRKGRGVGEADDICDEHIRGRGLGLYDTQLDSPATHDEVMNRLSYPRPLFA